MTDEEQLLSRFTFNGERIGWLGVEREFFLTALDNEMPVPESPRFIEAVHDPVMWTYELSACQVEHRTPPCGNLALLADAIATGQTQGESLTASIGLRLTIREVGPADMPLDIYPHEPRYRKIAKRLPQPVLSAACRVTGTHVHYGVESFAHGIRVLNLLAQHLDEFIIMGDSSNGERIRLYKEMATRWQPVHIESPEHFASIMLAEARAQNSVDVFNPRNCWHLIRFSKHGTVEVRAFGMTRDLERTIAWAARVKEIADAA